MNQVDLLDAPQGDGRTPANVRAPAAGEAVPPALGFFALRSIVNADRYAKGMAHFRPDQFGNGPAAPSRAHIAAVNSLLGAIHKVVRAKEVKLVAAARAVRRGGGQDSRNALLAHKQVLHSKAQQGERVWEFYLNLFNQRSGPFGSMLSGIDRMALDCYRAVYLGLGQARSIPSPTPFGYVETGFGPATFRRGVRLTKLGKRSNPFPLVKIPFHRLINPWSLGAVPHEVAHNLQSDLGLWTVMPRRIMAGFAKAGLPREAGAIWARWHKEAYADLVGTLLIGPAYVGSLMDVVGRTAASSASYSDEAVHPTPIVRVPMNIHLLKVMGFDEDAIAFRAAWDALYPQSAWQRLPEKLRRNLPRQIEAAVGAMILTPMKELGGKRMIDVVRYEPKHAKVTAEGAERLERGMSTGVLPERFLIGAARLALARRKASPEAITRNFYATLERS
ncbi:hypothetical protein [Erythrobacter sp. HKB08]|uniref:hypothetical protein n=1 Tax=Erythrobacter sp. HKB08 TaxID=2502843 RepID=UPI001008C6AE|nr:hypothetical protein [Erythrobacter sp. HKB08]